MVFQSVTDGLNIIGYEGYKFSSKLNFDFTSETLLKIANSNAVNQYNYVGQSMSLFFFYQI